MPHRETSDSKQAPAGRDGQRSALLRVAVVVGLPILSVILRLPIWFTLLLMLGLAVFLFVTPYFPKKEEAPEPKKAWTQLMNSCVRLRTAYDTLKRSPADVTAREQFLASEKACLSLLNSHADTDWGPDSEYAAKVKNEIVELSASARAECGGLPPAPALIVEPPDEAGGQGPTSGDGAAAAQAGRPSSPAARDTTTSAELQDLLQTSEGTAVQIGSPAPTAEPKSPPAATEQSTTPATEGAVLQPDAAAPAVGPETQVRAEEQLSTPASRVSAMQPYAPAPPARPEVPASAEKEGAVAAGKVAAAQPVTPAAPAKPEVPPAPEQQGSTPAGDSAAVTPEGSSSPVKLDFSYPAGRRLTPFLWLAGGVEDAAAFYVSVFKNSRVVGTGRYPEASRAKAWSVMTATLCLDGQELMLLDGGSVYKPPDTFQLLVRCVDQAEVDYYWERLLAGGGEESTGGWLKDRFGVAWQVIPDALMELLSDPNPQRAARATEAMLGMKKVDIARLREAVDRP